MAADATDRGFRYSGGINRIEARFNDAARCCQVDRAKSETALPCRNQAAAPRRENTEEWVC